MGFGIDTGGGKKKQWFEGGYGPQGAGGVDTAGGGGGAGGGGKPNPFGSGSFGGGSPAPGPNDLPDPAGVVPMVEGLGGKVKGMTDSWAGQSGYDPGQPMYDPTRADVDRARIRGIGTQQTEYNEWLKNAAMGKGPSVAQAQLSQGRDAAISAAASQAASARGGNAALANRSATAAGANLNMQAARDAAALRAQEQMGYANQWGQGLQAQRAGDLTARGQTIDEQKAQLAAETAYQQNKAQIAAGNAERGQGIMGEVMGGTGGGITDMVPGMGKGGFQLPSDERAKVITNPGQPSITTGGAMVPAQQPPAYSEQFAGIGKAYDEGKLGKTAQEQADEAETRRNQIQGIGQGMSNAKSDHGVGLVTSIIGMLSDERAKTITSGTGFDAARQAAEAAAHWLGLGPSMKKGVAESSRGGADYATGASYLARAPQERRMDIANATRTPEGKLDTGRAQNDYAAKLAAWEQAGRDADEDRRRVGAAKKRMAASESAASKLEREREGYRMAMSPDPSSGAQVVSDTGAKMFTDSDERAKVGLGDTRSGDEFNQAANARMGEDQDKLIEEALLRAGLDRVEREATVDGGLRAGKTNVARFDDVEPLVREMAAIPDTSWQYKPEFAEQTNQKMGLPPGDPFGHKEKVSATTQAYERIPATAGAVMHDPQTGLGKLDGGQLASTAATGVGAVARQALELEKRTSALEQAVRRALGGRG